MAMHIANKWAESKQILVNKKLYKDELRSDDAKLQWLWPMWMQACQVAAFSWLSVDGSRYSKISA